MLLVNVDVTIVIVLGSHEPQPYKMPKSISKHCVCSESHAHTLSHLPHAPQAFLHLHNSQQVDPINNSTIGSKCLSERKTGMCLNLNQIWKWLNWVRKSCAKRWQAPARPHGPQPSRSWMERNILKEMESDSPGDTVDLPESKTTFFLLQRKYSGSE